jgi:hypothetical protein
MNLSNQILEIIYRINYTLSSFILCIIISFYYQDTLLYICFWYIIKDIPIYYSGLFEYYWNILELSFYISIPIFITLIIIHIYSYLRPIFYYYQIKYYKYYIIIYISLLIISTFIMLYYIFPLFYSDFSIITKNIEFQPNITLIIKLQNTIMISFTIILLLIFKKYKLHTLNRIKRSILIFIIFIFISLITPPGLFYSITFTLFLCFIIEIIIFINIFYTLFLNN